MVPEIWCATDGQTDRWMDRWKKWHIEVGVPPKNIKKTPAKFTLEGLLFSSAIKNDTEKIFVTTGGLIATKYGLIQMIGIINLNEIKNWTIIEMQNIYHTFLTGDVLNFMLKLIDNENEEIKFEDKEKKFPMMNFLLELLS